MRIAIAQMDTVMGAFSATVDRMAANSEAAAREGADVLVFPSTTLTGFDPAGLLDSEEYLADLSDALDSLAGRLACPCLVPFVLDLGAGEDYEVLYVEGDTATPLRLADCLGRVSEGDVDMAEALDLPATFDLNGVDCGLAFDAVDLSAFASGDAAADVIFYLPFHGFDADDESTALAPSISSGCFLQDAADANSWLVACGPVGGYDDAVFTGGSFVLAPWGQLACVCPSFEETLGICDIDVMSEGPLAEPRRIPDYRRSAFLWDALSLSVSDFVHKQGAAGLAVLLDGSLASSAAATLAVDAVGPVNVHALIAPTIDAAALADARTLAQNLRLDVRELGDETLAGAASSLGLAPDAVGSLAWTALSAMAEASDLVICSPADKTSAGVGPIMPTPARSFAPFGDVYRTDVCALVRQRDTVSPVIPEGALDRLDVPSDLGLEVVSTSQEGRLSELDAILLLHVEQGMGLTTISSERGDDEVVSRVLDRVRSMELARRVMPMSPVVSARTFGERAWPATLAWEDRPRTPVDPVDEESLRNRVDGLMRQMGTKVDDQAVVGDDAADALGFLSDFAQGGGMRTDGGDLWGTGLFSKN